MTSETDPFRLPTDEEITSAEARLGVLFHADYRAFLKSGGDVANAIFDAAVVLPGSGYCDLFEIAHMRGKTRACLATSFLSLKTTETTPAFLRPAKSRPDLRMAQCRNVGQVCRTGSNRFALNVDRHCNGPNH